MVRNKKKPSQWLRSNSQIQNLLNTGPTTVTGAGEATVKSKGWGETIHGTSYRDHHITAAHHKG